MKETNMLLMVKEKPCKLYKLCNLGITKGVKVYPLIASINLHIQ